MSFTPETLLRHWQTLRLIPRYPFKVYAGALCQRLNREGYAVGKRTVERDLQSLSRIFPLVVDERSKPYGWSWGRDAPSFDLPGLSSSEALTLLMAREHLRPVMPASTLVQLDPYFKQAEQKLSALAGHSALTAWPEKVCIIPPSQPLIPPQVDDLVLATLQEALLQDRQCQIVYQSRESGEPDDYPIHPLGLVQRGVVLYLVCTIKAYPDIRILALHRVKTATLLADVLSRPKGFDLKTYLATGALGWGSGDVVRLEVLFSPEIGKHLKETPLAHDQTLTVRDDGRFHITATVPDNQQLRWWLLGFGDGAEVIAPTELRQELMSRLQKAASQYVAFKAHDAETLGVAAITSTTN